MTSLQTFLKNADERVRKAAADALNEAAEKVAQDVKTNMAAQGIQNRTGKLRGSLQFTKATPDRLRVVLKSEVFKPAPKRPGSRNPAMRNRYKNGVPYGRILEFSPRIGKPFFYTAWYKNRRIVKDDIIGAISNAWQNS